MRRCRSCPTPSNTPRIGCITGASARNWAGYGQHVELDPERFGDTERALLTDPQTSGGLLISCAPEIVTEVLSLFLQQGFEHAAVIGEIVEGEAKVRFSRRASPIRTSSSLPLKPAYFFANI